MEEATLPASVPETLVGLTSAEAQRRLAQYGLNEIPERRSHPVLALLKKFWGPVPWMLEATVLIQVLLDKRGEAAIVGVLLAVNAAISFFEEGRANKALALLRSRLTTQARVLRDGRWQSVPAANLVPGDSVHLRMGDLSPADIRIVDGDILLDQSALTGESVPIEAGAGALAYAAAVVRRGEGSGEVVATGPRTYFGKTAELVRTAKSASHLQTIIFSIVKTLIILDALLVCALLLYAAWVGLPFREVISFALILLVASVPVALPATFTLATALGSTELARSGVLVTRLSAIEEAAGMDMLCTDKTGTITENRLALAAATPLAPFSEDELIRWAALACDPATQDPIDLAILAAAGARGVLAELPRRLEFVPFDPARRYSLGRYADRTGNLCVVKGAPRAVIALVPNAPDLAAAIERLAGGGNRVLAVASGSDRDTLSLAGLVALEDPPRADSGSLVRGLQELGVRVVMVTGDNLATACAIAQRVGIGSRAAAAEVLDHLDGRQALDYDVYARVFPEHKIQLVRLLQAAGHIVGMTGDGVNDAPALKQADVGIAVGSATDVARAAAGVVLTTPGLVDALSAVQISRRIYQRMLTYTINKIMKTSRDRRLRDRRRNAYQHFRYHAAADRFAALHERFRHYVDRYRSCVLLAEAGPLEYQDSHADQRSPCGSRAAALLHRLLHGTQSAWPVIDPAPDAGLRHAGGNRSRECLSRPRARAFLAVMAEPVAGRQFNRRSCSGGIHGDERRPDDRSEPGADWRAACCGRHVFARSRSVESAHFPTFQSPLTAFGEYC